MFDAVWKRGEAFSRGAAYCDKTGGGGGAGKQRRRMTPNTHTHTGRTHTNGARASGERRRVAATLFFSFYDFNWGEKTTAADIPAHCVFLQLCPVSEPSSRITPGSSSLPALITCLVFFLLISTSGR